MTNDKILMKVYTGFVKAAVANGLSIPQANLIYKQAGLMGQMEQLPGMESSMMSNAMNSIKGLAGNKGVQLGGAAGAGAGGGALLDHFLSQQGGQPAAPTVGAGPETPGGMGGIPEWMKMLGIGAGAGGLGLAGGAMMGGHKEEDKSSSPVPQLN